MVPLDAARADVVGDGVADDLGVRIDDDRDFGLGDVPRRVSADDDLLIWTRPPAPGGLEENLWARGCIDARVNVGGAAFFDASVLRPLVGDAGCPDFGFAVDGGED